MKQQVAIITFLVMVVLCVEMSIGADCRKRCQACPPQPTCAPGISLISDECGCCKVCARQLYEPCDANNNCDHHKNLYCSYDDIDQTSGICVAKPGRSCYFNKEVYLNGASFSLHCKLLCTCIDGDVGCQPMCPMRLPIPKNCPHPRLTKKPGQCCEEWICVESSSPSEVPANSGRKVSGITRTNYQWSPFGLAAKRKEPLVLAAREQDDCIVQTTPWSACSKTCGWGVSERVTNDNKACKMEKETRLCQIRPCSENFVRSIKRGKKCIRTPKAVRPVRYSFSGCKSKVYTPKYCGQCVDGRCCTPERTKTVSVTFNCDDGYSFKKPMMIIKSCSCHRKCAESDNDIFNSYRPMGNDNWKE